MAIKPEKVIYDGLAQVAHAIRRSTALTVAMNITDPGSTIDDLTDTADRLARWIGGAAQAQTEDDEPGPSRGTLGEPWPPTD